MRPTKRVAAPIFAIALYPGHLWSAEQKKFELNPNVPVTHEPPPPFLVQAEDDPVESVNNSLVSFTALRQAGVPVELHLYAEGGHGFGLRRTKFPSTAWSQLVERWLGTIGMISQSALVPAR
jgi:acetyl esterase/lipase